MAVYRHNEQQTEEGAPVKKPFMSVGFEPRGFWLHATFGFGVRWLSICGCWQWELILTSAASCHLFDRVDPLHRFVYSRKKTCLVIKSACQNRKIVKNPLCKRLEEGLLSQHVRYSSPLKACAFLSSSLRVHEVKGAHWNVDSEDGNEWAQVSRGAFLRLTPPLHCNFISGEQPGMFPPCLPHLSKKANETHMLQCGFYPVLHILTFFLTKTTSINLA